MKTLRSLIILSILLAVMVYFLVRGAGRGQFETLGRTLAPVAFLEVNQREGRFDGTVAARNVQLVANRQHYLRGLYFDEVTLHTPSVWHLLSTPFGSPSSLPDTFAIDFSRMRGVPLPLKDVAGNAWFNFKSLVPFDGLACRDSGELQDSDFGGMQLAGGNVNLGVRYRFDNGVTTIELSWDNGTFAQLEMKIVLESFSLERWLYQRLDAGDAAVRSMTATLTVGDYPVKRNAYCAKLREQTVEAYVESNLALTREFLNSHGVTVEDRLWQAWTRFNTKGGKITLRSNYGNALRLATVDTASVSALFDLLKLRIDVGAGELPLRFQDFVLPTLEISAVAPPLEPGAEGSELEGAEVSVVEAPVVDEALSLVGAGRNAASRLKPKDGAPAVTTAKAEPVKVYRGPREIPFEQVGQWIGRDLIFVLDSGMRYRGRPRAVTGKDVRVDVILTGGTAGMTLSRNRIKRVLVM